MLEDAAQWLATQERTHLAVDIVYRPTSAPEFTCQAVKGRTLFRAEDAYGVTIRTESRDFLVSASALTMRPVPGDIVECQNRRYEVLAPNGEPVWRWSGAAHDIVRVHTKEVGDAAE